MSAKKSHTEEHAAPSRTQNDIVSLRIHIVGIVASLITLIFVIRLFYIQVIDREDYEALAKKQYVKYEEDTFNRGTIFLTHKGGEPVPAAQLMVLYDVVINPSLITDSNREATYQLLVSLSTTTTRELFEEKTKNKNDPHEVVLRGLTEDAIRPLKGTKLPVDVVPYNSRTYTLGEVASKVIGYVGYDGISKRGLYGIENRYDDVLRKGGNGVAFNFFAELFGESDEHTISNEPRFQGDVVLTLEAEVSRFLHEQIVATKKKWNSDMVGAIIMDPQTGAILAMDAVPSFDPGIYEKTEDLSYFSNQLVSGAYEMGSIIKPLTVAAALDSQSVTLDTTYVDTGFRELDGFKVRNFDEKARGTTDLQTILDKSLNVGIVFLVERMGVPLFQKYFQSFGLGKETGIDIPQEAQGLTKNLESSVFVDSATAGFGQGIALTPIQTIRALAALGNGGKLVDPYIVDRIIYDDGTVKETTPTEGLQVIERRTSETVSRMLTHVVDHALKNGEYKMKGYSIAAKTGTAQMSKQGGGYYDDRYLHSFFGYFPAYNPRFVIFIFQTHPKGAEYASATLTDPFFSLVKFLISYYQVPPDRKASL